MPEEKNEETESESGESSKEGTTKGEGESSSKEKPLFENVDSAVIAYKELQQKLSTQGDEVGSLRVKDEMLSQYGGPEKVAALMNELSNDPGFAKYLEKKRGGLNEEELDEDTRAGLKMVREVAAKIAKEENASLRADVDRMKQRSIKRHFNKLDKNYPDWREHQSEMKEGIKNLSSDVRDDPDYEDLVDLYNRAALKKGKLKTLDEWDKLQKEKLKKDTRGEEGESIDTKLPRATTLDEAFAQAKASTLR